MYVRTGNGPAASFKCGFELGKWHFVVLHQTQSKDLIFKTPVLSAYVDGRLVHQTSAVRLPGTSGILSQRTIGNVSQKCASPVRRVAETGLRGRVSVVAAGHGGQLTPDQVEQLYALGPGFVPTTHFLAKKLRSPMLLDFVFAPRSVCAGGSDGSSSSSSSISSSTIASADKGTKGLSLTSALLTLGSGPAPIKPPLRAHLAAAAGTRAVVCQPPRAALFAAVGLDALLLLFHPHTLRQWPSTSLAMAADVLRLAIAGHPRAYYDFHRAGGARLLARLLRSAPPEALTVAAVRPFASLGALLAGFPETRAEAYMPLIFNFACWRRASLETQRELSETALSLVSSNPKYFREVLGVGRTVRGLEIYSHHKIGTATAAAAAASSATLDTTAGATEQTPSPEGKDSSNEKTDKKEELTGEEEDEDTVVIRRIFCNMIEIQLKEAGEGLRGDELQPLVRYLRHSAEEDVADVVYILIRMMGTSARGLYALLAECSEGYVLFSRLLGSKNRAMRAVGLQLFGLYLRGLTACADARKGAGAAAAAALIQDFPFEAIKDHLARHTFDYETYLYLVQFFMLDYKRHGGASPASPTLFAPLQALASYTVFPKPFPASQSVLDIIEDLIGNELGKALSAATATGALPAPLADCFRMIEDLTFSIEMNQALQTLIVTHKFWHKRLILLLLHVSNLKGSPVVAERYSKEIQLSIDHIFIAVSLLLKAACMQEGGWRQIEELLLYTSITWPPQESSRVSLRILYQLMGYIAPYAKHSRQNAQVLVLWTNFVNLACMIEHIVFKPASGAAATSDLYYDENGGWRDAVLVLKFFQVYDALWSFDYVRNLPPVAMESIHGRKRNSCVVLLRLALATLQELHHYFCKEGEGGGVKSTSDGDAARSCFEFYAQTSKRVISILNNITQTSSKSIVGRTPKDLGVTAIWVIYSILRAMGKVKDSFSEENRALFIVARNVAITARPHIEAFLANYYQQSQPQQQGSPQQQESERSGRTGIGAEYAFTPRTEGRIAAAAIVAAPATGATASVGTLPSVPGAEETVWTYLFGNRDADSFIREWFVPYFKGDREGVPSLRGQVEEAVAAFERKQFVEPAAAAEPRREAAVTALREEISKSTTEQRLIFLRELGKCEMKLEQIEREESRLEAFTTASAEQETRHDMKAVVRAAVATNQRGCWKYKDGRRMYPRRVGTGNGEGDGYNWGSEEEEEEEEEEEVVVVVGMKEKEEEEEEIEEPFWKLDQTLWSKYMTRPIMKIDFKGDSRPRKGYNKWQAEDDEMKAEEAKTDEVKSEELPSTEGLPPLDKKEDENPQLPTSPPPTETSANTDTTEATEKPEDTANPEEKEKKTATEGNEKANTETNNTSEEPNDNNNNGRTGEGDMNKSWEWHIVGQSGSTGGEEELPSVGEKYLSVLRCTRVKLLDKVPGRLCLTGSAVYFFREGDADGRRGFKRWDLGELRRLYVRRSGVLWALEVYVRRGYLFEVTSQKEGSDFGRRVAAAAGKRGTKQLRCIDNPARAFRKDDWTGLWQSGALSNFQYLMLLNAYSGRTFNDLAQYPVFPWVLADYAGAVLDLGDPRTFRDLSKPVGALNPSRLEAFLARFHEMQADAQAGGDGVVVLPPFIYGSHYSTLGAITFWLTRLEPFSAVARELQGGHFDHPDRLFFSVETAWSNCLQSTSDVKELVPEFFYLSDFLRNVNGYWLGRLQSGDVVDDVVLPPWAAGSPELFVRLNAEALESPYVSAHLHEWIDLIFGYKQRGQAAIDANNLFYHLTYPESIDAATAQGDSLEATALRTQLAYFGQCPTQLFTAPHPPRTYVPPPLGIISDATQTLCPAPTITVTTASEATKPDDNNNNNNNNNDEKNKKTPEEATVEEVAEVAATSAPRATLETGSLLGLAEESVVAEIITSSGTIPSASCNVGDRVVVLGRDFCFNVLVPEALRAAAASGGGGGGPRYAGNEGRYTLQYWGAGPVCAHHAYPNYLVATTLYRTGLLVGSVGARGSVLQVVNTRCTDAVTCLAMNADGSLLAAGGASGLAELWPVRKASGLGGGGGGVVVVGPGGSAGGHTPQIAEDAQPALLRGQTRPLTCVCFAQSSAAVCATGAEDGTVCIHSIRDRAQPPTLIAAIPAEARTAATAAQKKAAAAALPSVLALAFTQQDDLVVLRRGSGAVEVYTLNGRLVERIEVGCRAPLTDMFLVPGAQGHREAIVVLDTEGFTLVSTTLGKMPHPRERFRWTLPDTFPYNTYNIDKGFRWTGQPPSALTQQQHETINNNGNNNNNNNNNNNSSSSSSNNNSNSNNNKRQAQGQFFQRSSQSSPTSLKRSGPLAGAQQIISSLPLGAGLLQTQQNGVAFALQCKLKGARLSTFKQCDASTLYVMISIKFK